jgi:hypothetical protein
VGSRTSDGLDELLGRWLKQIDSWNGHSMRCVQRVAGQGRAHVLSEMLQSLCSCVWSALAGSTKGHGVFPKRGSSATFVYDAWGCMQL